MLCLNLPQCNSRKVVQVADRGATRRRNTAMAIVVVTTMMMTSCDPVSVLLHKTLSILSGASMMNKQAWQGKAHGRLHYEFLRSTK
ncbi:hypothetical protein KM043_014392 [Ampulex compressa]|nr:hypothetical protein KM043_014392 [Ampulex compressa]